MTIKDSKYIKINSVNSLYLNIQKMNRYFQKINENKYLTLALTNKSKKIIKKYEELWSKIRVLIRSFAKNLDDYDEKYIKIKTNSHDELPPYKTIEIHGQFRDVF